MNIKMELPTEEQAARFSEQYDKTVEETLAKLLLQAPMVRADIIIAERQASLSSPVRVAALLYVKAALEGDAEVECFDYPTAQNLRHVLAKAESYEGDWFHSRVTLRYSGGWSPLEQEVAELDEESGVFVEFHYPDTPAFHDCFSGTSGGE